MPLNYKKEEKKITFNLIFNIRGKNKTIVLLRTNLILD